MFVETNHNETPTIYRLDREFVPVNQLLSQHDVADGLARVPGIVEARVTEDYHLRYPGLVCAVVEVINSRGETTEVVTVGDVREEIGSDPITVRLRYIKIEGCDEPWGDPNVLRLDTGELDEPTVADWVYNLRHWAEGLDAPAELSDIQLLQKRMITADMEFRAAVVRRVHESKDVVGMLWSLSEDLDVPYSEVEQLWLSETHHPQPSMVVRKLAELIGCQVPEVHTCPTRPLNRHRRTMTLLPQFSADGMWRVAYNRERTVLEAPTPEALVARIEQHFGSTPREQWLDGARIEAPAQWRWWVS